MANYLLLLREHPAAFAKFSPEEMQRIFEKYRAWVTKVRGEGRLIGGNKLRDEGGKVLFMKQDKVAVVDGPYSEAKEVVGGYFLIAAANYDEAIEIAQSCPHVHYGIIEVREVDPV